MSLACRDVNFHSACEAEECAQDFLAIGAHACKNVLQALLRDKTILKVCDFSLFCILDLFDKPLAFQLLLSRHGRAPPWFRLALAL